MGDFLHDGQPQASAAWRIGGAVKPLKHPADLLLCQTWAVVFHFKDDPSLLAVRAQGDTRAPPRVSDRVVDQIGQRLAQQKRIA